MEILVITFLGIFGTDNNSSSLTDNCKNNFLVLGEGSTKGISDSVDEQKFSINFTKANTKCCSILHNNGDNSYLFVNG